MTINPSETTTILSIRLIRSFEHRNLRFFPLKAIDLSWTTEQLMSIIKENIATSTSLPPPFRKFNFDTLKVRNRILIILRSIEGYENLSMNLKVETAILSVFRSLKLLLVLFIWMDAFLEERKWVSHHYGFCLTSRAGLELALMVTPPSRSILGTE